MAGINNKMRILILSQYCFPETDHKSLPLAKALQRKGYDVEILTGYPSHPAGKLFTGYSMKLFFYEYIDGIKINRVPLYITDSKSKFKRVMNYLSFAISACLVGAWMVKSRESFMPITDLPQLRYLRFFSNLYIEVKYFMT